ncbi:zinc-ribbon domain-containing protein [Salinibacterium sp. ZJ450]|uniref:zinc-ribbon domain-containing protein n=1 Tax=Salinibacterium sp. ZJ450 TaxID=2708338 RepID=UPI00141D7773|nr:zinc-ribbon domain-containing protein [Salinibacterium sp. ZJ450]
MRPDATGITTRPYRVRPIPLKFERFDSFAARLLRANHDQPAHQRYLLKLAAQANPQTPRTLLWPAIVEAKAGLSAGYFNGASETLNHVDGSTCGHCCTGLDNRYLCTVCANGESVRQNPHMDGNVCLSHARWVGPDADPAHQFAVGREHEMAESCYRRLRDAGLISAPFYMELRSIFRTWYSQGDSEPDQHHQIDYACYPLMIRTAAALTRSDFTRELFDPTRTYFEAFRILNSLLSQVTDDRPEQLARGIWLYLRPTFLNVREHLNTGKPYQPGWVHDFPLAEKIVADFPPPIRPLEPFNRYLAASGDFRVTPDNWRAVLIHAPRRPMPRECVSVASNDRIPAICVSGHRTTVRPNDLRQATSGNLDRCKYCSKRAVVAGSNDLSTTHPKLAKEFLKRRNRRVRLETLSAGSRQKVWWHCPRRHEYQASVSNRAFGGTGCPICMNTRIQPGVNDLTTLRPELLDEWDWDMNIVLPSEIGPHTHLMIHWRCARRHPYTVAPAQRSKGQGCPYCANKRVWSGFNDIVARQPLMSTEWSVRNPTSPHLILPGGEKHQWTCAYGHEHAQTVTNRIRSRGCPLCPRHNRILVRPAGNSKAGSRWTTEPIGSRGSGRVDEPSPRQLN